MNTVSQTAPDNKRNQPDTTVIENRAKIEKINTHSVNERFSYFFGVLWKISYFRSRLQSSIPKLKENSFVLTQVKESRLKMKRVLHEYCLQYFFLNGILCSKSIVLPVCTPFSCIYQYTFTYRDLLCCAFVFVFCLTIFLSFCCLALSSSSSSSSFVSLPYSKKFLTLYIHLLNTNC